MTGFLVYPQNQIAEKGRHCGRCRKSRKAFIILIPEDSCLRVTTSPAERTGASAGSVPRTGATAPGCGAASPAARAAGTVVPVGRTSAPAVVGAVPTAVIRAAVAGVSVAIIRATVESGATPCDDRRWAVVGRGGTGGVVAGAAGLRERKNRDENRHHEESERVFHIKFLGWGNQRPVDFKTERNGISVAPAGLWKTKFSAPSHGWRFQLENSTSVRGKFGRSVNVTASRRGRGFPLLAIQISQLRPGARKAGMRCCFLDCGLHHARAGWRRAQSPCPLALGQEVSQYLHL